MANAKIERRLDEEIQRMEAAGQPDRQISVVIELAAKPGRMQQESRPVSYSDLEQQVRAQQQGILERLSELGVTGDVRQMTLSNSIEVRLTPAQIRQMGGHKEVKLIILNREEQVTA